MDIARNAHEYGDIHLDILTLDAKGITAREDALAIEEALEIRLSGAEPVITMRTPGHDRELAAGLMLSEGLARTKDDFEVIDHLVGQPNVLQVVLKRFNATKAERLERSSLSNSACGVCGKKKLNLEAMQGLPPLAFSNQLSRQLLSSLPAELHKHQTLFEQTGGLHAAALFDTSGQLLVLREDVGRHNAVDKLNGWAVLNNQLPLSDRIMLLSGRASFELIQKCIMARVSVVCAISAPSSYAVRLAREFGITLVGFLREGRFNIYSGSERILGPSYVLPNSAVNKRSA
ncbi:formate dehydrogenase accessory sulfurtransferase FdhD [Vreelandella sulfidaeris]|jgi:FdhD protein|uniref:Sulfur carrier protein FdhD n=4 Tax=Vreelandella TaxID=3137766 RepID=A0A365TKU4_9GAMM|nr:MULTISPECIES: formate dehydrogenase accessory sulfurtransferase FdhD [Halomonas]AJY52906.1 Protein fdhD [Halomonas sp. KO116]NYS80054.1 formate dehydrogenase accessory sulfurtransferase FdhD [Halomonas glaciei]RBI65158.1 formate dehydrogenase accessory sulfurtransferase FdhD [Halomonas sulfidaeris]|tara:strand:- start:4628 stop:5494 length:867 start_codon:yes stop_codon:yes gene_type:complete